MFLCLVMYVCRCDREDPVADPSAPDKVVQVMNTRHSDHTAGSTTIPANAILSQLFLSHSKTDVGARTATGVNALHLAVSRGRIGVCFFY